MTDISPTSAYLSDSEIIAWLQAKENDQYGDLRTQMDASSERGDLMKDLTNLRAELDHDADPQKTFEDMQSIVAKYKNTPEGVDVDRLLLPSMIKMLPALSGDAHQQAVDGISSAISNSPLPDAEKTTLGTQLLGMQFIPNMLGNGAASDASKELSDKLKSETDQLGRVDQLALINIQQIMADARQTDQLASNVLSSRNQASNSIVGNIRG
jgi:hypothetical protein